MLAEDVMTEDPIWIDAGAVAGEAIRALLVHGVRHLPVLRAGVVVGMLSDRDLEKGTALFASLDQPERLAGYLKEPVAKLMTSQVFSVEPNSDLKDAVSLMVDHHVGAIPVVDPGSNKLVGIISYVDVLRILNERL